MSAEETVLCPKCGHEKRDRWSSCNECFRRQNQERKEVVEKQDQALLAAGFSKAFHANDFIQITSCLKCGAAVALVFQEEGVEHPLMAHERFHEELLEGTRERES